MLLKEAMMMKGDDVGSVLVVDDNEVNRTCSPVTSVKATR